MPLTTHVVNINGKQITLAKPGSTVTAGLLLREAGKNPHRTTLYANKHDRGDCRGEIPARSPGAFADCTGEKFHTDEEIDLREYTVFVAL